MVTLRLKIFRELKWTHEEILYAVGDLNRHITDDVANQLIKVWNQISAARIRHQLTYSRNACTRHHADLAK